MRTLFREKLVVILALGCLLSHGAASAATLREIIEQNGRDYVLNNVATVASQIDDRDRYFLARILIGNLRGSEAPEILIPLAQRGDIDAIRLLAMNFGTGKEGIKTNKSQATRYQVACEKLTKSGHPDVSEFVNGDFTKISWTRALRNDLGRFTKRDLVPNSGVKTVYRPFTKQWLYFNRHFNEVVSQMPRIFPDALSENLMICVSGIGARSGFFALIVNALSNLHTIDTGQCFPLKLYEPLESDDQDVDPDGGAKPQNEMFDVYNHKFTMTDIPLEAYDYVVNGKLALEWVMERQAVTTHKDSGIVNDANLWATETVGDAAYPLKLFQRVITVSLETMKIVRALPRLDIVVGGKS